jgi:Trm5-related predicted tRNA methylase
VDATAELTAKVSAQKERNFILFAENQINVRVELLLFRDVLYDTNLNLGYVSPEMDETNRLRLYKKK